MNKKKSKKESPFNLAQTWKYCLQMWKWIAENYVEGQSTVRDLKAQWVEENRFEFLYTACNCFFCDYCNRQRNVECQISCPGAKISPRFHCKNDAYHFSLKPVKFYQKLKRMDAKRRAIRKSR